HDETSERRTASPCAAGARTGAHLAGAPAPLVTAMASCGRDLGLAFQVSDDLLDVTGQAGLTGKPRGIDLRDGNPSLPVVLGLACDDELVRLFAAQHPSPADVEAGIARLRRAGVLRPVAERARAHSAAALSKIQRLAASPYRDALVALAESLADRPG